MKQITYIMLSVLLAVLLLGAQSCTGDFDDINRNPNQVSKPQLEADGYLINTNLKGLQNMVIPVEEHLYQFYDVLAAGAFAGYVASTPNGWKEKFSTFNPSAKWLKVPFVDVISQTYPFYRALLNQSKDDVALALAKLFRVAIMHRITDTYGPIPYSKIVEDKKELLTVPYDSQETVYMQMFKELDEVLAVLNANINLPSSAYANGDGVYSGNLASWIKFTNSLKLRMAMRLSYIVPVQAQQIAEQAVADGVITMNSENAQLNVEENRSALIYQKWEDSRAAADIICYMKGYNDPRISKMFTKGSWNKGGTPVSDYVGIRVGIDPINKDNMLLTYSNVVITDKTPYLWMNAAEVTFLRAEGALRGWNMQGDAKSLYEKAVGLSFEEHGAGDAAAYLADNTSLPIKYEDPLGIHSYRAPMSTITVGWSDQAAFNVNLERIITQKYIAIFPLSVEAWAEYRRTGYPKLMPVVENKSGGTVDSSIGIRRLPYPVEEYAENATYLQQAITNYLNGEDNGGTRVWWDVESKK